MAPKKHAVTRRPRHSPLPLPALVLMEGTSSVESPATPLRDEGLLALMRAFPQDILGKVVLSFLSICDEERLWAEESAFRTVYTWYGRRECGT